LRSYCPISLNELLGLRVEGRHIGLLLTILVKETVRLHLPTDN
jgi:hypothetical protein